MRWGLWGHNFARPPRSCIAGQSGKPEMEGKGSSEGNDSAPLGAVVWRPLPLPPPPPPPPAPEKIGPKFPPGLRPIKIFSGAFGSNQFRPKVFFGAFASAPPRPTHPPTAPLQKPSEGSGTQRQSPNTQDPLRPGLVRPTERRLACLGPLLVSMFCSRDARHRPVDVPCFALPGAVVLGHRIVRACVRACAWGRGGPS